MTAWIDVIHEPDAGPELARAYDEVKEARGGVANIFKAQSLNPAALFAHKDLYTALVFGEGPLSRRERELIAVAVSRANACPYCVTHHADALGRHTTEPGLQAQVAADYTQANLTPRERAMLDHAVKLTETPFKVTEDDIGVLRKHGLTDREILDLTHIAAYFNFVNRIASGLGVDAEDVAGGYEY